MRLKSILIPFATAAAGVVASLSLVWGGVVSPDFPLDGNDKVMVNADYMDGKVLVDADEYANVRVQVDEIFCEDKVLNMVPVWLFQQQVTGEYEDSMLNYINGLEFPPSEKCLTDLHGALSEGAEESPDSALPLPAPSR